MRLKSPKELTWDSASSDLIQEDITRNNKNGNNSYRPPHNNHGKLIMGNNVQQHGSKSNETRPECSFCGIKGHRKENCYISPENPDCKMTTTAKKNLKAVFNINKLENKTNNTGMHHSGEDSKGVVSFGGIVLVNRNIRNGNQVITSNTSIEKSVTCLHSGTSVTMFKNMDLAENVTYISGSNDRLQLACGKEEIKCDGSGNFVHDNVRIPNSLHVSSLNMNLVSVGQLHDQKKVVIFTSKGAIVLDTNKVDVSQHLVREVIPRSQNGLYMFTKRKRNGENISGNIFQVDIDLWHKRLVHINENTLNSESFQVQIPICHICRGSYPLRPVWTSVRFQ